MSITTLDPNTALVVIDLQVGVMTLQTAPLSTAAVAANAATLARAFRKRGLPVVLATMASRAPGRTEVPGPDTRAFPPNWTDLAVELDRQPSDLLITRHAFNAFYGTPLDLYLRRRGMTQIVLCGIATGVGVESTGRDAFDRGYNVTFAVDAMADRSGESHAYCVATGFPRLGETGTVAQISAHLA